MRHDKKLPRESNLHESARLGEEVVDGVAGHPHHRGKREAEPETLCPSWILVAAQLHWLEGDDVEDEDAEHDEGGKVLPAEIPEDVWLVPRHLLNAVAEPENLPMRRYQNRRWYLCAPKNHPIAMV